MHTVYTTAHSQSTAGTLIVFKHIHVNLQLTVTYKDTYWGSSFPHRDTLQSPWRECLTQCLRCLGNACPSPHPPPFLPWSAVVIVDHRSALVPGQSDRREITETMYLFPPCHTAFFYAGTFIRRVAFVYLCHSCLSPLHCSVKCELSPVVVSGFTENLAGLKHSMPPWVHYVSVCYRWSIATDINIKYMQVKLLIFHYCPLPAKYMPAVTKRQHPEVKN